MENKTQELILNQIKQNKSRFNSYNKTKLENLYLTITDQRIIDLFEAIPILLVMNQPEMPGYINTKSIINSIYNYQPSASACSLIKSRFPNVSIYMPKSDKKCIQMFALMGSGGTIAYNKSSDFDFWICIEQNNFEIQEISLFKMKCRLIENWISEKFNIEIHFFLNDIAKVKKNIFDEDSENEMKGTSLGELLKEEFFRSSIVLAGKIPFWWVVPTDCDDKTYDELWAVTKNSIMSDEFIDLGNLYKIAKKDFLASAFFQFLKFLGNPFKSIIKLGLLERYLHTNEATPFISNYIKKNVQDAKLNPEQIDSYVIMFNQVFDYYNNTVRDKSATLLLEKCFYLKVDPKLSVHKEKNGNEQPSLKYNKMQDYVKQWGWPESEIINMDNFESWTIVNINDLWKDTKEFIRRRFNVILSNIEFKQLISQQLMGIVRKFNSYFTVADNKIDNSLSFKTHPYEKLLLIQFKIDKESRESWILSKREFDNESPVTIEIRKDSTLLGIIVWISLNKLFLKDFTRIEFDKGLYTMDPNFLRDLITELTFNFSIKRIELMNSFILRDPFPVLSYIIINPYTKYSKKIDDIFFLFHNSWGETKFEKYKSEIDIAQMIIKVINGAKNIRKDFESTLQITSSYPYKASKEFHHLRDFLKDIYSFFIDQKPKEIKRYITVLGNNYFVFAPQKSNPEENIHCISYESETRMLENISYNPGVKCNTRIDNTIPELNLLRLIVENFKENAIQIYCQKQSKYCFFYISDEMGSIIFCQKHAEAFIEYLTKLYLFAKEISEFVCLNNPTSSLAKNPKKIEIYNISRDNSNNCKLTEIFPELDPAILATKKYILPFKLYLHLFEKGEIGYQYSIPDGSNSQVYNRANKQQIITGIKLQMTRNKGFNYFVTGIDLANVKSRLAISYTSFAFSQKIRFENLLEIR